MMVKTGGKNRFDIVAGDILCAKDDGSKMIFDATDYDSIPSIWTPIGIVVIPPSHDIYGTGEGAAIALNWLNSATTGGNIANTEYARYTTDSSRVSYDYIITITNTDPPTLNYMVTGGKIPSDIWVVANVTTNLYDEYKCLHDPGTYYYDNLDYPAPSPYLENGVRHSLYYEQFIDGYRNAFSDFDGYNNTYMNTENITNYAVVRSSLYFTIGTNQGDWYIPAVGELGYLISRMGAINDSLKKLSISFNNVYDMSVNPGVIGGAVDYRIWSSSKGSDGLHWVARLNQTRVGTQLVTEYALSRSYIHF